MSRQPRRNKTNFKYLYLPQPLLCCKQPPPQAPPTAASRFHHRSKQSWWNTHNSHTETCAFHAHSHIWFGAGKRPPQWWHLMMLEAIVGDASEARQGNILIYIYIHMNIYLSSVLDNLFVAPTPVVPATSFSASKLHGNQALTAFPPLQHSVSHAQKSMHKPRHGSLSKKACPRKHAQAKYNFDGGVGGSMGIPAENGPMHQNDYFLFAPSSPNFFLNGYYCRVWF